MEAQRQEMKADMGQQQQEMKAEMGQQRQEMEQQRHEMEQQRQEIEQLRKPQMARDAITEQQLETLQSRLETLHEARLLTDEELDSLEDTVVDWIEGCPVHLRPIDVSKR